MGMTSINSCLPHISLQIANSPFISHYLPTDGQILPLIYSLQSIDEMCSTSVPTPAYLGETFGMSEKFCTKLWICKWFYKLIYKM
jgi:hypothetical protein